MAVHVFEGKWISDAVFANRLPRNIYHKQLQPLDLPNDEQANAHILFRKKFVLSGSIETAKLYITADDYYKVYINGQFVGQGPAPSYPEKYNYNVIDVSTYLRKGENTLAVHTYYQGLINRVWVSGDYRHGLLCDLTVNEKTVVKSDESFLTHRHTGFSQMGMSGYATQFLERYDSRAKETHFYLSAFDDSAWETAKISAYANYNLQEQKTKALVFERIAPAKMERRGDVIFIDFGKTYVGYLSAQAKGENGEKVAMRFGQELNEDGTVRHDMRCYCNYVEEWVLSGKNDALSQFDYKAFRYVELQAENNAQIADVALIARHYPFSLHVKPHPWFKSEDCKNIWDLCVNSQHYGVQDTIQDCMDREKGFYLGDGCYSALAHYILTGDDSMVRKLIDDSFETAFITQGLMTVVDCSFMQEIAEYPLMLVDLLLWHYRLSGDKQYLQENYKKCVPVIEEYRVLYEKDGLLQNLDRWCLVEWPINFQDGYAVSIQEGRVCQEPHVAINAYYVHAIETMNTIADILGEQKYRDAQPVKDAFIRAFYDSEQALFMDGVEHRHVSLVGNIFPYSFGLDPDKRFEKAFLSLLDEKGYAATSFFTSFPLLAGFAKRGERQRIKDFILDEGTWKRMLREGATTTFEGWGKDVKWNTSLFHLTLTDAVVFMADIDLKKLFS